MTKKFFNYVIPSVMAMWVFSIYTMVDGIFVGRGVGPTALAAVNISMPFINFIFAISLLLTTGTSTLVAIKLGQGDKQEASKLFSMNIMLLIFISLGIMFLSLINLDSLARFLGATDVTIEYVKDYLGIIIWFSIFFIVSYSLEVLVKTDGSPNLATIGVIIAAIINIILDYIFVIKLDYGIKGAAYATGISQMLSIIIFLVHFTGKKSTLKFTAFKFNLNIIKRISIIGVPDCITEFSAGIIVFLFNQILLSTLGEQGVVTYTVISYVNTIVIMTMIGICQGMQPLVSFYYGKNDNKSVNYLFTLSLKTIIFVSIFIFLISISLAKYIVAAFISPLESTLYLYSVNAFKIFSISFLILGINILISSFYVAIEKPKYSMIISLSRGLFVIAISSVFMTYLFGDTGTWISSFVSEVICLALSFILIKKYFKSNSIKLKKSQC